VKKAHEQVVDFHRLIGASVGDVAKPDATVDMMLRVRLIAEEFDELLQALCPSGGPVQLVSVAVHDWLCDTRANRQRASEQDLPCMSSVADALSDLEYVTIGSAVAWGLPGDAVWSEVHAANMRKAGGPKDSNGKALKPPGWTPPDIEGVLKREAEKASRRRPHRRGDQVARLVHFWENSFTRWLLDEKVNDAAWWCYELHPNSGSIGKRELVDISVAPGILQPVERDRMPGE
jgi:predicted HAD superfamily Cof-like phosphohydrolase